MTNKAILGRKLGMTQIFTDDGRAVPVTVVEAGPCVVTQVRTPERDGYSAVQIGFGAIHPKRINKPEAGHLRKAGTELVRHLVEFRTDDVSEFAPGSSVTVDRFAAGEYVDVVGVSKGKGFAGVMKRWNFHGQKDSHGVERKHRSTGSVGSGTTPGRVYKGRKLPGQLGNERTTVMSLQVVETDPERNLILVKGALPGSNGSLVMIRNAAKRGAKTT